MILRGAELVRLDEKASVLIVAGLGLLTIIIKSVITGRTVDTVNDSTAMTNQSISTPSPRQAFQQFPCPFYVYPDINVDAGIAPIAFPVAHQAFGVPIVVDGGHHQHNPDVVHRDPVFAVQETRNRMNTNPQIHVDLTGSPSPSPGHVNHHGHVDHHAEPVERKPILAKFHFNVFLPNPLTDANKRSGVPITYIEYAIPVKNPLNIMIQIDGQSLGQLKASLLEACNTHKKGCGRSLRIADNEGRVFLKGYVTGGGDF